MQNLNGSDLPLPDMPEFTLAPIAKSSYVLAALFTTLSVYCFCQGNWIGGTVDLMFLSLIFALALSRYIKVKQLKKQHDNISIIRQIMLMPTFTEQGNSIILNFVKPSNRVMAIMDELIKDMKDSSHKK